MVRWSLLRLPLAAWVLAVLAGCGADVASERPEADSTEEWGVEKLYREARKSLLDGGYAQAIDYYEKLESRYPYGVYTQQAKIDLAYAYFKHDQPEVAIEAADRFIRLYPLHPNVDYAYYLKGLVNFRRDVSLVERALPQDLAAREMDRARRSFDDFKVLLRLFPDNKYSDDARQRMVFLRNQLADHELVVADYYLKRGAYVAVTRRARFVLENYPYTPATPHALSMLVKSYRILGLEDLAANSLRVLEQNFPEHEVTAQARSFQVTH